MKVNERIAALRKLMKDRKIDIYYIPNEDDHLSEEYTADYFKCKSFITGFSGEAGCAIVTQKFAGLWTDGRYFTQAEGELKGTEVTLMRMGQEGVPDAIRFLIDNTPKKGTLGFDGRVVSADHAVRLSRELQKKGAKLHVKDDLAGIVWGEERPAMPQEKLFILEKKYTGESVADRLAKVRNAMKEKGADALVLTALEDPCWLFNIRGNDIACTPVAYAFALITGTKANYYIDAKKLTPEIKAYFKENRVTVRPYDKLAEDLGKLKNKAIWASMRGLNAELYTSLDASNRLINENSPVAMYRAVKNNTEIKNIRNAHVKDGVAMVKFLKWVKENVSKGDMTEVTAQNYLYERRAEGKDYIEPSFPTISAYQANGAMMHYSATEKKFSKVKPRGFLLVDSGGTYKDGTTDITRTIVLGKLTNEEKMLYTLVLKGHLALANAKFLAGTAGNNLDILAREPLWNVNIDYQCGTGHGVGHVLSVHEGPHSIRWGVATAARPAAPLVLGMVVTDEPGVYIPHKLGIRIENELLVVKDKKNFYGQFLKFENITYCPYDIDAIDPKYLSDVEIEQINAYHKDVFEKLSPYLNNSEKAWLKKATRKITR